MNNTETTRTQVIELSLSRNYVSTWGLWEAIRELLQNAQDSDKDGYDLSADYQESTKTLTISNEGPRTLNISSLVLGNSVKSVNAIGKYGEGYKLALLTLLRLGKKVSILTGQDLWTPQFTYSTTYDSEVLSIEIKKDEIPENSGIQIIIEGINRQELEDLKEKSLVLFTQLGGDLGKTVTSDYGTVLLDSKYKGKFYVEGLYIQEDDTFNYGYSFNFSVVDLDRDRRAINYYDLLNLTTDTLISQNEDFSIVEQSIVSHKKDTSRLEEFFHEASEEFSKGYAQHFIKKHKLDEDTFIGTEKEVLVSNAPKTHVTDEVQAKIVNRGLGRLEVYEDIQNLAKKKDNVDLAWKYYSNSPMKQLHDWLVVNCKYLSNKQINKFIRLTSKVKSTDFALVKNSVYDNLQTEIQDIKDNFRLEEED